MGIQHVDDVDTPVVITGASVTTVGLTSTGGLQTGGTSGATLYAGTGAPSFAANAGDIYVRTDGTLAGHTVIYFNSSAGNHWAATAA